LKNERVEALKWKRFEKWRKKKDNKDQINKSLQWKDEEEIWTTLRTGAK
jgi:hypothetical protein